MKLEQQVCSLELAKKLKELGVKQESLWWWVQTPFGFQLESWKLHNKAPLKWAEDREKYPAFTVAELGEMLPEKIDIEEKDGSFCSLEISRSVFLKSWRIMYAWRDRDKYFIDKHSLWEDTEANARAKMLIWLIEQGYVNGKDNS